jgi:nonsense-mediated mRNA decay protein 3
VEVPRPALPELATVACCMCSTAIKPNPTNMCVQCIRTQVDITEGIALRPTMFQCRGCMRWLKPNWVEADLESRELMAICLRKVSGLNKVKLVDASWVWTEAHSRRLKLKLTVQKEVQNGAILQQALIVEFTVRNQQCTECQASYTNNTWKAVVQIRQRVDHKRTFFYLEQLILKHNAHIHSINVQVRSAGALKYGISWQQHPHLGSLYRSVKALLHNHAVCEASHVHTVRPPDLTGVALGFTGSAKTAGNRHEPYARGCHQAGRRIP